jgi:hypothetical protein
MHYSPEVLHLSSLKEKIKEARELASQDVATIAEMISRRTHSVHQPRNPMLFKRPSRPATIIMQDNIRTRKQRSAIQSKLLREQHRVLKSARVSPLKSDRSPFVRKESRRAKTMKDLLFMKLVSRDGTFSYKDFD